MDNRFQVTVGAGTMMAGSGAATEPTSGRRRPLADGVLHAYCLG